MDLPSELMITYRPSSVFVTVPKGMIQRLQTRPLLPLAGNSPILCPDDIVGVVRLMNSSNGNSLSSAKNAIGLNGRDVIFSLV